MIRNLAAGLSALGLILTGFAWHGVAPVQAKSRPVKLGLYHNGWDTYYRSPFGAAPTDSRVTLRLRSATVVTKATLYLQTESGSTTKLPMRVFKRGKSAIVWTVTTRLPSKATQLSYFFRAQAGSTVRWYGDNSGVGEGGPGQTYGNANDVVTYSLTVYLKSFHTPAWMRNAVVYQIFPDRFFNGNTKNDPKNGTRYGYITVRFHKHWSDLPDQPSCGCDFFGGDLQGIIDKLGYLHKLGVNVIYLNPIFLAPSNHKYDTSNFKAIDPEFGTLKTFKALVGAAKKLGIHLILDGVFEDTGSDSVYFDKYSRFPHSLGAYESKKSPYYPWYTFYQWPDNYADWSGVDSLPLLKESNAVKDFIFRKKSSVAQYWPAQGASGWRLDSANSLSNGYWEQFRSAVKAAYPQSVMIGEYWQDALPWLMGNMWDGVVNYQFREPVLDFFANGQGAQTPTPYGATTFLESEMGLIAEYPRPAIVSSMNIVDSHDVARILTDLNGSKAALRLVALFQMTWLGAPTVYYGDETGVMGASDPDDRRTFPWSHQDKALERYYAKIIHIRLGHGALTTGSVTPLLSADGKRSLAFLRQSGSQRIVVALNDSHRSQTLSIPVSQIKNGTKLTELLNGGSHTVSKGRLQVKLGALSGAVLEAAGR